MIKDGFISITVIKTKQILAIPLHSKSQVLFDKYTDGLPFISHQKFNDYSKELGEDAKINEPTFKVRFSGTERIESIKPKYEIMTS